MTEYPFFSIVLPTYGRGRHIEPTIASVFGQSFRNFELIVVGDGCVDDTEAAVRSFPPEQIRWLNLAQNTGSQSFPNNEGIRSSRGRWIAYIGHDDVWSPNHLECIFRTITSSDMLDFVVSGCVFYGPDGSDVYYVNGLFDGAEAPFQHFFPPSSISHRRDATTRIGDWRDPRVLKAPVDCEFLLRAAHAGLRFASTGKITVHKFAAGHRYLSYLRVSSDEQRECLRKLTLPLGIDVVEIISKSKKNGQYMAMQYFDFSACQEGYLFEQNRKNKGISRPTLRPLVARVLFEQTDESRALDWYGVETAGKRYRWSGPNPRPKILIPYTGNRARISIDVISKNPYIQIEELSLFVEDCLADCKIETDTIGVFHLVADIQLQSSDYTVLTLDAPTFRPSDLGLSEDQRRIGIAISDIVIAPIE